eukprot:m.265781 g.265781  ORF g.265781 m.265781 type:complete len:97 (+) comp40493_c2_seq16:1335-1625(+)
MSRRNGLTWSHLMMSIEMLWVEINFGPKNNILLCCFYRPPGSNLTNFLSVLSSSAMLSSEDILLLGDLNCDLLKPSSASASFQDALSLLHATHQSR